MKRCNLCKSPLEGHNVVETFTRSGVRWAVKLGPCGAIPTPTIACNSLKSEGKSFAKSNDIN